MDRDLYFFEYVERQATDVLADLLSRRAGIFQTATDSAVVKTEAFRGRMHVDVAGVDIGKDVTVELGEPEDTGYATLIPIRWAAASQAAIFPSLDGLLEITPLNVEPLHPLTQIGIIGHYRPPLSIVGRIGDAVLGHRIAEAAIRNFVLELAAALS